MSALPLSHSDAPATSPRRSFVPAVRLLSAVALASAATGGLAALTVQHLLVAMDSTSLAPAIPASLPPSAQAAPSLPATHDVLRDGIEPLVEPPPAS